MRDGQYKKKRGKGRTVIDPLIDLDEGSTVQGKLRSSGLSTLLKDTILQSRYYQILLILTVIGAILRLYALDQASLWLDEAMTYLFSINPFTEYWTLISAGGEVHPPLFYWLEYPMLALGHTETTLRFLPAIFGIITIPVIYFLGTEAVDRNTGILAAAFLTFSPFHLFYSQEARMYSLMLLFLALAMLSFFFAIKDESVKWWVIFGIFSALAFWTHFYSLILIAGLYIYFLVRTVKTDLTIKKLKGVGCSAAVLVLLCLPLLAIAWKILIGRTAGAPTWGIRGLDVLTITFNQFSGNFLLITVLFVIFFFLGLYMISRTRPETSILFIWLTILIFSASIGLSYFMPMVPRYLIGIIPIFFVGIASSYLAPARFKPDKKVVYFCLVLIVFVSLPGLMNHYNTVSKEDWRNISVLISENTAPGDIVVLMPGYVRAPFDFYYDNATDMTWEMGLSSAEELETLSTQKGSRKVIIALTHDLSAADPSGKSIQWVKDNTQYAGYYRGVYIFTIS
jgi:4-amino-4-deoxy-L-arabinose transferase-like glycosyltransferase